MFFVNEKQRRLVGSGFTKFSFDGKIAMQKN